MSCRLAADPTADLSQIDEFRLYDRFIALLLNREARKAGRYPKFGVEHRRHFNNALSWWLLSKGKASTTTIYDVPTSLCKEAVNGVNHEFDDDGLKRELIAGCLIEKTGGIVYFGHRSIQEFLAAEYLYDSAMLSKFRNSDSIIEVCTHATPEVTEFLTEFFERNTEGKVRARESIEAFRTYKGSVSLNALAPFEAAYQTAAVDLSQESAWLFWLDARTRFHIASSAREKYLLKIIASRSTSIEIWLAAVMQCTFDLLSGGKISYSALVAALINAGSITGHIKKANTKFVSQCVSSKDDPKTFVLVSATGSPHSGQNQIIFNPYEMAKAAQLILGFGPKLPVIEDKLLKEITVPVSGQHVYGHLQWKNDQLEALRPYFNNADLRNRIIVVEVERRVLTKHKTSTLTEA